MTYVVDTNICIYAMKNLFPGLQKRWMACQPFEIAVPAIVKAELLVGALKSNRPKDTARIIMAFLEPFEILPFDEACLAQYAAVRAELELRGQPIGPNDTIIAATALAHECILVTHNVREFARVRGLRMEDWTK